MVLTDRQRGELHVGIYEYLKSQPGEMFKKAAQALAEADPSILAKASASANSSVGSSAPMLEKKWTAVPRLQKKVMELEKQLGQSAKMHGHRTLLASNNGEVSKRMLPREPAVHTLEGHKQNVTCVEVHPVFTVAVSGSEDATVKVWDHESGEFLRTLKGHTNHVLALSFTPSGSHLASSSSDLSIKIWDFTTYSCIRTLRGHDHTISAVKFIPSILDVQIEASSSSSAQYLVSASRDHSIKFWELETGFCVATNTGHTDWVRCLAVKTNGSLIASSGNDQQIIIWNAAGERKKVCELRGHEHVVECLSFLNSSPSSAAKASISITTKKSEEINDYLVSGSRDRTVRLWSISSAQCLSTFSCHENWVRSVILHSSGDYIISCGDDRTIRVIDIKASRCMRTLTNAHQHFVSCISMHHTMPILVSGGVDHSIKCWMLD